MILENYNARDMNKESSRGRLDNAGENLKQLLNDIYEASKNGDYSINALEYNLSEYDIETLEKVLGYHISIQHEIFNTEKDRGRRVIRAITVKW